MNESIIRSVKQVVIVIVIVVGVTVNTILLKGAGSGSDIMTLHETVELHKQQMNQTLRQNMEYLESRVTKTEARQDSFYNSLNRRVDIVENQFSRIIENKQTAVVNTVNTINNTYSPQISREVISKELLVGEIDHNKTQQQEKP